MVSTAKYVEVTFNDMATITGFDKAAFRRSALDEVQLTPSYVVVKLDNGDIWKVSKDGAENTLPIDTVDAVTPTDLSDLYDKIKAFIEL